MCWWQDTQCETFWYQCVCCQIKATLALNCLVEYLSKLCTLILFHCGLVSLNLPTWYRFTKYVTVISKNNSTSATLQAATKWLALNCLVQYLPKLCTLILFHCGLVSLNLPTWYRFTKYVTVISKNNSTSATLQAATKWLALNCLVQYLPKLCTLILFHCGLVSFNLPTWYRFTPLGLEQSFGCPSASEATLMNTDRYVTLIYKNNNTTATLQTATKPCLVSMRHTIYL